MGDLGDEDDIIPFRRLLVFLKGRVFILGPFETIYQEYRGLFCEMIEVSKKYHREACFELVLEYLLKKYQIDLDQRTTIKELLEVYYQAIYEPRKVYSDTLPTLLELKKKGIPLGIISNTTNPIFMKNWERRKFGLDGFFELALYSSSLPFRKPHPSIFKLAIHRLKLKPDEIAFVGDNPQADIVGAQGVGMVAVWLNRNGIKPRNGIQPDYEITTLTELMTLPLMSG